MELGEGKPGSPVNGYKEIELALGRLHPGDVVVEVADRMASERLCRACRPARRRLRRGVRVRFQPVDNSRPESSVRRLDEKRRTVTLTGLHPHRVAEASMGRSDVT